MSRLAVIFWGDDDLVWKLNGVNVVRSSGFVDTCVRKFTMALGSAASVVRVSSFGTLSLMVAFKTTFTVSTKKESKRYEL